MMGLEQPLSRHEMRAVSPRYLEQGGAALPHEGTPVMIAMLPQFLARGIA